MGRGATVTPAKEKDNRMTHARLIVVAALCAIVVAGCAKRAQPVSRVEPPPASTVETPPPPPPAPMAAEAAPAPVLSEEELFARKTLAELNAERPLGDVFFDLDQSAIQSQAREVLQQNAAWLRRWPSTRITVEGHSDERGTGEYNLALGERRAQAVRAYLVDLGVPRDRVEAVGKGKEAPFCSESSEACWQQNRRGHFIITDK